MNTNLSTNRTFKRMLGNILSIFVILTMAFPATKNASAQESAMPEGWHDGMEGQVAQEVGGKPAHVDGEQPAAQAQRSQREGHGKADQHDDDQPREHDRGERAEKDEADRDPHQYRARRPCR